MPGRPPKVHDFKGRWPRFDPTAVAAFLIATPEPFRENAVWYADQLTSMGKVKSLEELSRNYASWLLKEGMRPVATALDMLHQATEFTSPTVVLLEIHLYDEREKLRSVRCLGLTDGHLRLTSSKDVLLPLREIINLNNRQGNYVLQIPEVKSSGVLLQAVSFRNGVLEFDPGDSPQISGDDPFTYERRRFCEFSLYGDEEVDIAGEVLPDHRRKFVITAAGAGAKPPIFESDWNDTVNFVRTNPLHPLVEFFDSELREAARPAQSKN